MLFQRKEIAIEQFQLELGDVLWYLCLFCETNNIDFSNIFDSVTADTQDALGDVIIGIADSILLDDPISSASSIARCIKNGANILKISASGLMEQNINKLSIRYAGKKAHAA